jgi:two-component system, NtrC family, sensor kinase
MPAPDDIHRRAGPDAEQRAIRGREGALEPQGERPPASDVRVRQLEVLNEIGRQLAALHSLDELFHTLYEGTGRVLQRDAFFVALWDEAGGRIEFPLICDGGVEYQESSAPLGSGPTSEVIRGRRTLVWHAERGDAGGKAAWGDRTRRSAAAVYAPMLADGRVLGVVSVHRYEGEYTPSEVQLCEMLANHAGVALANVRLYERLRASDIQFRELIAAIERMEHHCVIVTDMRGIIRHAAGTAGTHGYAAADLVGQHVDLLGRSVPEAARITAGFTDAARQGVPWTRMVMATHRDGHNFPIHISSSPYLGPTGEVQGVVTIGRDQTREVETQQRLLQSAKLASIGELVAGVAHELNNPLTVIKSTAHLLQQEVTGTARDDAEMIVQGADRAARIVRNLLHFARQTRPEKERVTLNSIVEQVIRFREKALVAAGISVACELDPGSPVVFADSTQLEQVLLNLLNNAEQAITDAGRGSTLLVSTCVEGGVARITVVDDGPGIAPEHLPRIFDPFFTTRRVGEGTGLGLALSHGIVTEHGGQIWARSEEGDGATFVVELPLAGAEAASVAVDVDGDSAPRCCATLIVDDEPGVRRSARVYFERRGHHVAEAASGVEALRFLEEAAFDVVLLDLRMPGLSGEEVYAQIRECWPERASRVIFTTGDVVSASTRAFLQESGAVVFEKPYHLPELALAAERIAGVQGDPPAPR